MGLLAGQGTAPGPSSVYTLLWHQPVTIDALADRCSSAAAPELAADPIDSELYYWTYPAAPGSTAWFIGFFRRGFDAHLVPDGQPAGAGRLQHDPECDRAEEREAGAAYCVFNFYTRTVVYLRVTGFTQSGTAVAADATEWAYS